MLRRAIAALLLTLPAAAAPAGPVRVAFACADDDLQSVGLLCTDEEPCSIYLELNALAPLGRKLFLAGDLHATSGTISSILLSSDDGGSTWKEPAPRIRGAALDQLQFYDAEHGWAAGETQYPLPRDPFFLVSTDGGDSWRQRAVTEEGGFGAIQRFWFDSPQHGELVVDAGRRAPSGRYLAYESETGGGSWMARSMTDALPKLKHAPPVAPEFDFRIQPAADGKTYRIERRSAGKWEAEASFLIEVASCKVKPPETPQAPAPETPKE